MNSTLPYDPDRYRRLRELVDRAAERPAAEWASFLERECPADPALRSEALRLLEHSPGGRRGGLPRTLRAADGGFLRVRGAWGTESRLGRTDSRREIPDRAPLLRSRWPGSRVPGLRPRPGTPRRAQALPRWPTPGEAEEGRALAKVASPYVARCHGIERIDGEAYLVVEYVPGRNLAEVRRDGPLDLAQVVRILAQLAEGVAAVHARGLIHRDIKPANVILHDDGTPRLVDFGLAAHLGGSRLRERSGSPPYMAPEQARGEWDRIDFRTDVFGLGGVLYKLLTDHAPHAGSHRERDPRAREEGRHHAAPPARPDDPRPGRGRLPQGPGRGPREPLHHRPGVRRGPAAGDRADPGRAPPPAGIPAWVRWGLPAAVVACGLLALAVWLWPRGPETATTVDPARISEPAAGPLQAEIAVKHYKDLGDGRHVLRDRDDLGDLAGQRPPAAQGPGAGPGHALAPGVRLPDRAEPRRQGPALRPGRRYRPRSPRGELDFPEDPADYFGLTDGVGLQAFVVVASDRPLPAYESWKTQVPGGLAWSPVDREGLWTYDSAATVRGRAGPRQASR